MELNGAAVRAIRLANRRTQKSLSLDCGITQGYIANIEAGRQEPSDEIANCIAFTLGLDDLRAIQQNPPAGPAKKPHLVAVTAPKRVAK